ncbi:MAG: hypothetical protein IJB53_12260 [Mailhella sp.]|nr:hypothetical protein [Mailhella sp.]
MSEFILEAAQVATPVTVEENIRRGREAMKHVIDTAAKEYHAMYRKELGWIAFSWGTPGTPPPDFKSKKEAAEWWANLPGKTNGQKGRRVFSGGRGVSHIIAKRDWEAKWMDRFEGQSGREVALKCVEVIARGTVTQKGARRIITFGKILVGLVPDSRWAESKELRAKGKKKEEFWVLSGFEIVDNDEEYGITESADEAGVPRTLHRPTHTAPFEDRCCMGATETVEKRVPDSPVPCKPSERKVPEYGTGAYGFLLDL